MSLKFKFGVKIRPSMREVVTRLGELYELALFTASEQTYADQIISKLGFDEVFLPEKRLYRENCTKV